MVYRVNKCFGHFLQEWNVDARNEIEAWNNCERDGKMLFQTVYKRPFDRDYKGEVNKLGDKNDKSLTDDLYAKWLKQAIEMGMHVTPSEYEKIYGLPFVDVY